MPNLPIIEVQELSKRYQLGAIGATTLRESLSSAMHRLIRPASTCQPEKPNTFWALQEISFSVHQGEVLGIIGRNGAGKSTLLKVLSRITEPSQGKAVLRGRVASLLEVGTGFHPELTGKENVYLNGAILGMNRREIATKLEAISTFAGVEQFMETPVKRYSSGMRVRLAFAVAAHLDPEILIIDEVLAVGDAAFQKKCLGKIDEVARSGRTVLFVSHNMASIQSFCTRAMVIDDGKVIYDGEPGEAVVQYYRSLSTGNERGSYTRSADAPDDKPAWIEEARLVSEECGAEIEIKPGRPLKFEIDIHAKTPLSGFHLGIGLENMRGIRVCTAHTKCDSSLTTDRSQGHYRFRCEMSDLNLANGLYHTRLQLESGEEVFELIECAFSFRVLASDFFENGGKGVAGVVLAPQQWTIEQRDIEPPHRASQLSSAPELKSSPSRSHALVGTS